MSRYRLIADHGHPFEAFEARDDGEAEAVARDLAERAPTAKKTGYRLEIQRDAVWQTVRAWMPRRVVATPGAPDQLVHPPKR